MRFGSVCSGIEAASVAWQPLGWKAQWFSEIEPFPCALLAHHYPNTPNLGDMTQFESWPTDDKHAIDLLCGGTPCQSFSVAGLRKGLDDPRGNLMLTFGAIAAKYRPQWLVWENVPGVLSSNGGRDFGSFLGLLGLLGYGFAYRVLNAQYFGVAQRRRRVFVVGYFGNWRPAAAVLFERYSLSGHPAPSREKRKGVAASIASSTPVSDYDVAGTLDKGIPGRGIGHNGNYDSQVVSVTSKANYSNHKEGDPCHPLAAGAHVPAIAVRTANTSANGHGISEELAHTLDQAQGQAIAFHPTQTPISSTDGSTHALGCGSTGGQASVAVALPINMQNVVRQKAEDNRTGFGVGDDTAPAFTLTKGHSHAVAYVGGIDNENNGFDMDAPCGPLMKGSPTGGGHPLPAVAYTTKLHNTQSNNAGKIFEERVTCLDANSPPPALLTAKQVRRLIPIECERLQGFPDGYTAIPWRKKPTDQCPDGPRYKALGNSWAVPNVRWIGERIAAVAAIKGAA
jgi:DNA (cytosine-5)-methyltransferase 1